MHLLEMIPNLSLSLIDVHSVLLVLERVTESLSPGKKSFIKGLCHYGAVDTI